MNTLKSTLFKFYKIRRIPFRSCHKNNIILNDLNLSNYLNSLQKEYTEKTSQNVSDRRLQQLQPIINLIQERASIIENLTNVEELISDKDVEIRDLAVEEQTQFKKQISQLDDAIKEAVLPVEIEDESPSILLEISAGVGGQEAMLFANELFEMYKKFAIFKNWEIEIADYSLGSENAGVRHAALLISGNNVYKYFKHEAGVHRVQRIPATEKSGRIHTSTVSVVAIPQPDEVQINIDTKDLKVETKRATGAGGQHVNTTDSAVRIVHLPTGIAVECQTDRSQHKNRQIAMQRLRAKLYEVQMDEINNKMQATKKSQVKSNFRNEKIRTYNFSQDRITDHRLSGHNVHNLKGFMLGGEALEELILKIDYSRRVEMLKSFIKENTE